MIDEARTLELFGYTSDSLTHGSHKKVCAVCDECGKVRVTRYNQHGALCRLCASISDERRKKISEGNKGKKISDETRKKIGDSKRGAKNPNYGKKLSEERKQWLSEINKGKNHPNYGKKRSDETRRKLSDANKGKKHTDATKRKMSKANKGKKRSDETKRNMSEARRGEKGANWQGGVSFEPYCQKFNEAFKESIREKFGRVCFLCPKTESENGRKLSVHHVNYDKSCLCDDVKCEFVPLCDSCHSKTNYNQEYWQNLIMEKLKTETFKNYGG